MWWAVGIGSFCPKLRYFTDQNGPIGAPHGIEFWLFLNEKMSENKQNYKPLERKWKNWENICPVSKFLFWVMILKLSKKVLFLHFCADLSKRPNSVKVAYIYASENFRYTLSENDLVYRRPMNCSWDVSNENIKKMLTLQKFNKILQLKTLIPLNQ